MRNFCNELKTVTEAVTFDDVKTSQQHRHPSPNLQHTKATGGAQEQETEQKVKVVTQIKNQLELT